MEDEQMKDIEDLTVIWSISDDIMMTMIFQNVFVFLQQILNSQPRMQDKLPPDVEKIVTIKVVDGRYQIKQLKLGEGSFAKTYLSYDLKKNQVLACKMIQKKHLIEKINLSKNKSLTKEYFINALKNEVKTWKSISHKSIVGFADFSETQNNVYFFLEYCSGGNLETYLRKNGYIPEAKALPLILQLASGCSYLFNQGIYHRDLKTENILINDKGELKLSDFGFAKMVAEEEEKNSPTTQTSVGTPIYMSPQVILGEPYTIKCDVWSLGVVFYKMLINLYPWEKTENIIVLVERMKDQIHFAPNVKISDWLKKLIRDMITYDEEKRISIKEVHARLVENMHAMEIE